MNNCNALQRNVTVACYIHPAMIIGSLSGCNNVTDFKNIDIMMRLHEIVIVDKSIASCAYMGWYIPRTCYIVTVSAWVRMSSVELAIGRLLHPRNIWKRIERAAIRTCKTTRDCWRVLWGIVGAETVATVSRVDVVRNVAWLTCWAGYGGLPCACCVIGSCPIIYFIGSKYRGIERSVKTKLPKIIIKKIDGQTPHRKNFLHVAHPTLQFWVDRSRFLCSPWAGNPLLPAHGGDKTHVEKGG